MKKSHAISDLHDIVDRTSNDVKVLIKHFHMIQTQIDQLTKVQKELLVNNSIAKEKLVYEVTTRGGLLKILCILKDMIKELNKILNE